MTTLNATSNFEKKKAKISVDMVQTADYTVLKFGGFWTTHFIEFIDEKINEIENSLIKTISFDLSKIKELDTAGAWLIHRTAKKLQAGGTFVVFNDVSEQYATVLKVVAETQTAPESTPLKTNLFTCASTAISRHLLDFWNDLLRFMNILGATIQGGQMKMGRGHGIRPAAIVHQIDHMGVRAFPVIILMSFMIGAIIAQQGAFQLRYFGAEIFVVDLVGVLVLREIGVLLTAIMIAGRSGSAITAQIGSMKMREEIDALHVIGLNPIGVLVFPRLVSLMIVLPILTVVADLSALVGACLVTYSYSGISPAAFISRLHDAVDLSTYFSGLIKAPFMALIIGIIASVEGLKVGGSAEDLGNKVTTSVVKSIFVVIVIDGLFAIFYAAIEF
jgi:phospholipid/cholesterol/gamma-HCH transport system permease protein